MKKQQVQLLALIIVLVALVGGYFGLKQYNSIQAKKPQEEKTGEKIVNLKPEDIVKFSYDYEGIEYAYENVEGTWQYSLDPSLKLNEDQIEALLSNIAPLTIEEAITDVTDMTQYGLDQPSRTISFESAQESHIFYVGDYNSLSSVYYICKPSDATVYVVNAATIDSFNVSVTDLVEETAEESTESSEELVDGTQQDSLPEQTESSASHGNESDTIESNDSESDSSQVTSSGEEVLKDSSEATE